MDQPPVGRYFIDSMEEMQTRLDLKLARLKKDGYRFVNNPQREKLIAEKGSQMLLTQIMLNIKEREAQGISQEETKLLLKKLATESDQEDNVTLKKAERLYKELLIEANAQLGLVQLPEDIFGKYRELIRVTQFEAMRKIDFDGKDPRVELKRMRIQAKNKVERQIYTQLSDGSVPSFNQFQAIKKELTDKQQTPLTIEEQRKEDIKQYYELESMATEQNAARINKLQNDLPSFRA